MWTWCGTRIRSSLLKIQIEDFDILFSKTMERTLRDTHHTHQLPDSIYVMCRCVAIWRFAAGTSTLCTLLLDPVVHLFSLTGPNNLRTQYLFSVFVQRMGDLVGVAGEILSS
jgi:hypothetical protein